MVWFSSCTVKYSMLFIAINFPTKLPYIDNVCVNFALRKDRHSQKFLKDQFLFFVVLIGMLLSLKVSYFLSVTKPSSKLGCKVFSCSETENTLVNLFSLLFSWSITLLFYYYQCFIPKAFNGNHITLLHEYHIDFPLAM